MSVHDSTTTLTEMVDLDLSGYEEKHLQNTSIKPLKKSELWAWVSIEWSNNILTHLKVVIATI